ncbi:hypothetical protein BH24ACI4_BH24ACI4_17670 [soil metagenome]
MARDGLDGAPPAAQRLPRNRDLGDPPAVAAGGARGPDGVEVHVGKPPVNGLLVAQGPTRVHAEDRRAPAVLHAVDRDAKVVVGRVIEVAPEIPHAQIAGPVRVDADDADVEVAGVEQHTDLRGLRRRVALPRFGLNEAAGHLRPRPVPLVQSAVDDDGPGGAGGDQVQRVLRRRKRRLRACDRGGPSQRQHHDGGECLPSRSGAHPVRTGHVCLKSRPEASPRTCAAGRSSPGSRTGTTDRPDSRRTGRPTRRTRHR